MVCHARSLWALQWVCWDTQGFDSQFRRALARELAVQHQHTATARLPRGRVRFREEKRLQLLQGARIERAVDVPAGILVCVAAVDDAVSRDSVLEFAIQ